MKRWVLVLTIAIVVAIALAGAYWWTLSIGVMTASGTCEALECGGPSLPAFGSPTESSSSGHRLYDLSVQSAGGGLVWGDLGFGSEAPNGNTSYLGFGWNFTVFGADGEVAAYASWASGTDSWGVGADVAVTTDQILLVTSPAGQTLSGDSLVVYADGGGFIGSVTIAIP